MGAGEAERDSRRLTLSYLHVVSHPPVLHVSPAYKILLLYSVPFLCYIYLAYL